MHMANIDRRSLIGLFTVTSGALRVTDPCYDMDTWCAGTLPNVRNGGWKAQVGYHMDQSDLSSVDHWIAKMAEKIAEIEAMKEGDENFPFKEGFLSFAKNDMEQLLKRKAEYAGRVAYIHIFHESVEPRDVGAELDSTWQVSGIDVGVDSGQAGFFDNAAFASVCEDSGKKDAFYDAICNLTLGKDMWGVNEFGAVSNSGYGDGSYDLFFRLGDDGQVEEAVIAFITQYDDEEANDE